eukprot:scaffold84480_cov51-Attheya_sp.AAC.1
MELNFSGNNFAVCRLTVVCKTHLKPTPPPSFSSGHKESQIPRTSRLVQDPGEGQHTSYTDPQHLKRKFIVLPFEVVLAQHKTCLTDEGNPISRQYSGIFG